MTIYIGSDHRGFAHKEKIKAHLKEAGYSIEDCGARALNPEDDYPLFAKCVAEKVGQDQTREAKGILLCGSGVGVDIVANKVDGVRSAHVMNEDMARSSREHDDANVLSLPADHLDEEETLHLVDVWLATAFSGEERHTRRIKMIRDMETASEAELEA